MTTRPPRLAESLLRLALPADDREAVLGDLTEEFAARVARDGRPAARRWYRRQVRASLAAVLSRRLRDDDDGQRAESSRAKLLDGLGADLRDALRSLRAAPGVTATALCILALGIGAGTAIFSVVDAVALRGLPFDRADELLAPGESWKGKGDAGVTPQDFLDWRARQDVFSGLAATTSPREAFRFPADDRRYSALKVTCVTANLFDVLGVAPRVGRAFADADEAAGAVPVAILSDGFWRARFAADPLIVGRTMTLTNGTWTIVGVMPPEFTYPLGMPARDLWVPYVMTTDERTRGRRNMFNAYVRAVGRLRPGVTVDQARSRMRDLTTSLKAEYPAWFENVGVSVPTLKEAVVGPTLRSWMLMCLGAVLCVLAIAVVNVANLLLARATVRARDIAVRAALGASRWQLVRALLAESLVLSLAGTALGVAAAYWGVDAIKALLPAGLPRADLIAVNIRVLAAASTAAIATGLACGVVPALQGSRIDLADAFRDGGARGGTTSAARQRLRGALVAVEISLATMLLVGAGLFVTSFVRLMRIDIGLDYRDVVAVGVYPLASNGAGTVSQDDRDRAARALMAAADRLRSIPGVEHVAVLDGGLPLSGTEFVDRIAVPGRDEGAAPATIEVYRVSPDYAATVKLPLLRGRSFTDADNESAAMPVAVLNAEAVRQYLADRDPIGAVIDLQGRRTIVGIVGNTRPGGPETGVRPEAYLPLAQGGSRSGYVLLRTGRHADDLTATITDAVASAVPDARIGPVERLDDLFGVLVAQRRFNMLLVGLFGVLAIAIASAGVYGVIAYLVEQRTAEIGVRIALGADPAGILRLVLSRAAGLIGTGVVIGLAGAAWLAGVTGAFLFEVQPHEPAIYATVAVLLFAIGLAASVVPARRAARVDPLTAFRTS